MKQSPTRKTRRLCSRWAASNRTPCVHLIHWKPGRPGAYSGMLDFGHRSCKCGAIYLRSEGMASTRQIDSECSPLSGRYQGKSRHNADMAKSTRMVESRCGAVALGRTYLFPPLSSGGALLVRPWLRFHISGLCGGITGPPRAAVTGIAASFIGTLASPDAAISSP